jgi:hypothetical protein
MPVEAYAEMKNIPINAGVGQAVKLPELTVSVGSVTNVYPDNVTEIKFQLRGHASSLMQRFQEE